MSLDSEPVLTVALILGDDDAVTADKTLISVVFVLADPGYTSLAACAAPSAEFIKLSFPSSLHQCICYPGGGGLHGAGALPQLYP